MAGIADIGKALQHAGREGAEALDDFPRLLEASHMGITGGEKAVGRRVGRKLLKRSEERRRCLLVSLVEKLRDADSRQRPPSCGVSWTEAQRAVEVVDRKTWAASV